MCYVTDALMIAFSLVRSLSRRQTTNCPRFVLIFLFSFFFLLHSVPTKSVVIFDKNLKTIDKVAGPFDEDSSVSLICDASEGKLENAIKRPMSQHDVHG